MKITSKVRSGNILIVLLILMVTSCHLNAQCIYTWEKIESGSTIVFKSDHITDKIIETDSLNVLIARFVNHIKIPRFSREFIAEQVRAIDSLKMLKPDSATVYEIDLRTEGLSSVFQIHDVDSVEYALYDTDTFKVDKREFITYQISSNLASFWNEDFSNWMFLYCKEFGIIQYDFRGLGNDFFAGNGTAPPDQ